MKIATLYKKAVLAPLAGVAALGLVAGTAQAAGEFEGVEVNIMTFTGPQIAEPLQRRAPDFNAMTGAQINIVTVPFSDLYTKVLTDWASGTNSIDAAVFAPQWGVDYIVPGYMENLSERVAADAALQEDDIAPFFREFSQKFAGDTYMLTLDGDFQMVYYRSDVFADAGIAAPETWQDYVAAAEATHGQDMNGDGTPDYGSCISKKRSAQAYWMILSIAGGYLQSQGTSQGIFFDTETMAPLVNNEAFAAALDIYTATTAFGPPDEINLDVGDTRSLFTSGRCALTIDWGDIGTLAIDPETSQVIDKVGSIMLPGSTSVLDRASGALVPCDAETCPYAINGVNRAPFAAFGGWSGGINANADDKVKDAAYAFFSHMSQPGAVQRGRDHRHHRLQPLSPVAVRRPVAVGAGGDERGCRRGLSRCDSGQPQQPEHGARSAHPAEPGLSAGGARQRHLAARRRRDRQGHGDAGHRRRLERAQRRERH